MIQIRNLSCVVGVFALTACLSVAARAQEGTSVGYDLATETNEISELRTRIAALEQQLEGSVSGGYASAEGCCCCESCCCNPCCRSQGVYAGGAVVWLKPHHSNGTGVNADALLSGILDPANYVDVGAIDPNFDPSYRIWIGWQRCDGLGFRARYWEFDHGYAANFVAPVQMEFGVDDENDNYDVDVDLDAGDPFQAVHAWDVWVLDLEMTDSTQFGCCWDLTYSAGFRYVEYNEINGVRELADIESVFNRVNFEGIGLTAATELRNQFSWNLGWFLNLRFSAMMGDEDNSVFEGDQNGADDSISLTQRNDVKFIYEAQAGAEYIVPICSGGYYYLRGGVEMQWWDDFGVDNQPAAFLEDFDEKPFGGFDNYGVGFGGFFISAGIQR